MSSRSCTWNISKWYTTLNGTGCTKRSVSEEREFTVGTIHHHGILVTGHTEDVLVCQEEILARLGLSALISAPMIGAINDYTSFAVFPDGSKEGWEDSDKGDDSQRRYRREA